MSKVGDVEHDERGDWVIVTPPVFGKPDEVSGMRPMLVGASRVRLGSSAHQVHAAADPRIAASLPRVRP